jgi:pimeloyl-ACP methyl ester carboxylesterase
LNNKNPQSFIHKQIMVDGISIHVVESGVGKSSILFLHGWPENWMAFKDIMISLSNQFHVVAIDLPGIGKSTPTTPSHDKSTISRFVYDVIKSLKLDDVTLVGHDVGGQIVYAFLHNYPNELSRAVIMNVAIPGIEPWDEVKKNPYIWHFAFHLIPELPELLIYGKQAPYFDYFYNEISADPNSIDRKRREVYVESYSEIQALKTGFEWYRAFPQDEKDNIQNKDDIIETPVLYLREGTSDILELYLKGLHNGGLTNLQGKIIENSGHFSPEEQPKTVISLIKEFIIGSL